MTAHSGAARSSFSMLSALAAIACVSGETATGGASDNAPTLALEHLAYNIERYKGRTIRVCGRIVQSERLPSFSVEHVPEPGEVFFHALPKVFLATCGREAPRLDSQGCIAGRIAREDGSLEIPAAVTSSDAPVNYEWFLHPQCGRAR